MQITFRTSCILVAFALLPLAACGRSDAPEAPDAGRNPSDDPAVLRVGAIPDQDPERLQRQYGLLTDAMAEDLDVAVEYVPVTDYAGAVSAFRAGDLDLVWYGGLTGVQARLLVPGAEAIVQRDIDASFRSVFIANQESGLRPIEDVDELTMLEDMTFSFGSESSTSGRLMPQHFMARAGVTLDDLKQVGFSGSHDATIQVVESGSFDAGALNEQVWDARVEEGAVDSERVQVIWRTPEYYDYHWVIHPDVGERMGDGFPDRITQWFLALDPAVEPDAQILDLFGATSFIETENENYAAIEEVGRSLGKIE